MSIVSAQNVSSISGLPNVVSSTMNIRQQPQPLPQVEALFLQKALRQDKHGVLMLDCRGPQDFADCHIRNSINVALPSLMLRRLITGKLTLTQVLKHLAPQAADIIATFYKRVPVVLYDHCSLSQDGPSPSTQFINALCTKLLQEQCNAHCLTGGFEKFYLQYPEWCECSVQHAEPPSLVGLTSLRISTAIHSSEAKGTDCDSSLGRETPLDDLGFPVEIIPHLYLGNEKNSKDREALNRHQIRYIVNVTPNLPNVFESTETYKYMQIPIADHWSQNLSSFFPKAIQFIDEARENGVGVLVHCLAGISRSVTITVAYLMYKRKLSLEDAYEYVRVKKTNIAPNFNFMGQLQDFQQQLRLSPIKCHCRSVSECRCKLYHFMSPTSSRTSPDSGIEFDRFS